MSPGIRQRRMRGTLGLWGGACKSWLGGGGDWALALDPKASVFQIQCLSTGWPGRLGGAEMKEEVQKPRRESQGHRPTPGTSLLSATPKPCGSTSSLNSPW